MSRMVSAVRDNIAQLRTTSDDISSGNQNLGHRTEVRLAFTAGAAAWGLAQLNRLSGRFTDTEKAWLERAAQRIAVGQVHGGCLTPLGVEPLAAGVVPKRDRGGGQGRQRGQLDRPAEPLRLTVRRSDDLVHATRAIVGDGGGHEDGVVPLPRHQRGQRRRGQRARHAGHLAGDRRRPARQGSACAHAHPGSSPGSGGGTALISGDTAARNSSPALKRPAARKTSA